MRHQQNKIGSASKCVELSVELNLGCFQLKINCYTIYYESIMIIAKQKAIIDTQMIKRK